MKNNALIYFLGVLALAGATFRPADAAAPSQSKYDPAAITRACEAREYDKAIKLAETLTKEYPDRTDLADVLFNTAGTLAQAKQFDPAARFYRMLIDTFPKSKRLKTARTELAACYYYSRRLKECFEQVNVNLKLHPESRWVEYWRFLDAQIQFRLWKYAEAKTALEKFLVDYPNGDYTAHAKAYLGRIDPPLKVDKNGIVSYSGKFSEDIRLKAAIKALPKYVDEGFDTLKKQLGVDLRLHTKVLYAFRDVGPKTKGGLKATTRIIGMNNKPTTIIFFYSQSAMTNAQGFRKTTAHELKHAGFLGIMGSSYHDLPKWIREGLALWGSEDVEQRMQLLLCNEITGGRDPMGILDGIDDPDHNHRDYLEDGLAFQWLASKNPGNISAFCQRLLKGESYRKIWADLGGADYRQAMAEANAYCRRRVAAALGDGYKTFARLRKDSDAVMKRGAAATNKWLDDGGKAAFQKWLTGNSGHAAEPMALLSFARSLIIAGRHTDGRELLKKILARDGCRSTLTDDAQFWIGVSYNHQRDHANARKAFGVFLRDYPTSPYAKQLFGKMPIAGPVTK